MSVILIKPGHKSAAHVAQRPQHSIALLLGYTAPGLHIAGTTLGTNYRSGIRGHHSYGILAGTQTEGCQYQCGNNDFFHNSVLV